MFKCHAGHMSQPNEKLIKVVTKTRIKQYQPDQRKFRGRTVLDNGGKGIETVEEVNSCALHAIRSI